MKDGELVGLLRTVGFVKILLHISESEASVLSLAKDWKNPDGLFSEGTIRKVRNLLRRYGLVTEEFRPHEPPRRGGKVLHLVITPKGKRLVRLLRKLGDNLES